MEKERKFENASLVLSSDYKLISFNDVAKQTYPGISVGDYCYHATQKRDTPCLHCPIAGNTVGDCPVYLDEPSGEWKEAIFTEISGSAFGETIRSAGWIVDQLHDLEEIEADMILTKIREGGDVTGLLETSNQYAGKIVRASQQLYYAIYIGDLRTNNCKRLFTQKDVRALIQKGGPVTDAMKNMVEYLVKPKSQEVMRAFNEVSTLAQRIGSKNIITQEYEGVHSGWTRAHIIPIERDEQGLTTQFIYAVQEINEEKKSKVQLSRNAAIINGLSNEYDVLFVVNLKTGEMEVVKVGQRETNTKAMSFAQQSHRYDDVRHWYIENCIETEDAERVERETSIPTILKNCDSENLYTVSYRRNVDGVVNYHQFCCIMADFGGSEEPFAIVGFRNADEAMKERIARDEAQQRAIESQASRAALLDIIDSAEIGIWHVFYYNGQKPRMLANEKMQQLLGIQGKNLSEEETYEYWFSKIDEIGVEAVTRCANNMMAGRRDETTYLWHNPMIGEQYVRCGGTATYVPGSGYILRGYHYDVTNMMLAERQKLEHDELTGLYTREAFFRYAKNYMDDNPDAVFDIIMTDIKNFKLINSTYGEEAGDSLLRFTAAYFEQLIGDGICARYSADRFIGIVKTLGNDLSQTIRSEIAEFERVSPIPEVKVKCGVYEKVDRNLSIPLMCDRAILALKSVKSNYNQDFACFAGPVSQRQLRAQQYEAAFRSAIHKKEFVVWYQPKYDPYTREPVGAEALVRWKKEDGSIVPPFEFLPVYEEDGLISQLDEYVFREVCIAQERWMQQGRKLLPISINLSRNSMQRLDLVDIYEGIAKEYNIDPALVPIEITESAAVESLEVKPLADQFSAAGFSLHMDDLGSGRSSLNGLTLLHIDTIKLDKSLVDEIGNINGDLVLKHLIEIGKELGLHVVAEGVEDEYQLTFLKEKGCDMIQGYYFSKPLDPDTFQINIMEKR